MRAPGHGGDEAGRLEALQRYDFPDPLGGQPFDDLAALARQLCAAPMARIALVDARRARILATDLPAGDGLDTAFDAQVIAARDVATAPDTTRDPRFADHPLVTGDAHVRFHAGAPLLTPDGHAIGTLSVMDRVARELTPPQEEALRMLGRQAMAQLELRRQARDLRDRERDLDTAGVILLALDLEGRVTRVNRYGCTVLGRRADELIGRDFIETCVPAPHRPQTREKLRTVPEADEAIVEHPIVTPAGDERVIEWRTAFLRDAEGRIAGRLSTGTDITEHRRAEVAVREERDRAQRYLDTAEVLLLALDVDGRITSINRKGCDLLGWSEAELLGRRWIDTCLPERIRETLAEQFAQLVGGDGSVGDNPILTKDGRERLIEWRNRVLRDIDGRITGTFSSGTDITERHHAVEALRTAEERMRFALQSADVGIWDMDYATGELRWSETLETHYGFAPGTFGGTFEAFLARVHPDDRASTVAMMEKAMATGADFSGHNRALWPDGTIRWLSGAGRILCDPDGRPVRGLGISLDVTERRTLEEQYHQAQKMEAVGRLAGGVAHDFNNVLTAILGYCELLLAGRGPDDPDRADIAEIQRAGTRAAALTRQLLSFSRKQIIQPTLVDLNAVVRGMRAMLERLIGEDVKVMVTLRPGLAPITADVGQIEQVIMNLAVNARDAMPEGGTLTIETDDVVLDPRSTTPPFDVTPGCYVALTVTDTGTGMTPEVQGRLFEPFFTTKEAGKGTGLGLATVHGIVAGSGGSVEVHSKVGRGTSFRVCFPRAVAVETVAAAAPSPQPRAGSETVLVVDDAEGLRQLAKRLLERQGYTVVVAANANEALQRFEEHPAIAVLLTDVVMPGASGPELTRQLIERRPGLKVIYMSGYAQDAIAHHGVLEAGIAFLHKPFSSETLGRKIRDVLDRAV